MEMLLVSSFGRRISPWVSSSDSRLGFLSLLSFAFNSLSQSISSSRLLVLLCLIPRLIFMSSSSSSLQSKFSLSSSSSASSSSSSSSRVPHHHRRRFMELVFFLPRNDFYRIYTKQTLFFNTEGDLSMVFTVEIEA